MGGGTGGLVVVTPARNEADNLAALVRSVRQQTVAPLRWIIVDDSSTDGTAARATELCEGLAYVEVLRIRADEQRSFAAKVGAVHVGFEHGVGEDTEVFLNLDADATLPPDYFERVLDAFDSDATLGVFGGIVTWAGPGSSVPIVAPRHHVPGPGQAIRVETWHDVGGYWPLVHGGEDVAIYFAAMMNSWTSRNDPDLLITLRRHTGAGGGQSATRSMYERGLQDYDLGRSWWFEVLKVGSWLTTSPYVIGSLARWTGYLRAACSRDRFVDPDFVAFIRDWERQRVVSAIRARSGEDRE